MISSSDIRKKILLGLDAPVNSVDPDLDYYSDSEKIIPAINLAKNWLVSVVNSALGEKKIGEEVFRDIYRASVFTTTKDSRIALSAFPAPVWSINGVIPNPETSTTGLATTATPDTKVTYLMANLYHIDGKGADRLSLEEWTNRKNDPFSPGYEGLCDDLIDYAYLNPINYSSSGTFVVLPEIQVSPPLAAKTCTVFYTILPPDITSIDTDDLYFPAQVDVMIVDKALQYLSYAQGDGTNLFVVTQNDIKTLVGLIQ